MNRSLVTAIALSGGILVVQACGRSTPTTPSPTAASPSTAGVAAVPGDTGLHARFSAPSTPGSNADVNAQIAELRRLLAPFHNFDKAVKAGYSVPAPAEGVCLSDPVRGGMGYHYGYAHEDRVTDGAVSLLEPEFIVYSPTRNGGVRLSAVDYFVPYDTWPADAPPPSLLGVPFAREDALNAYVLHIWAFWPNPAGLFENYNPDVPQCPN